MHACNGRYVRAFKCVRTLIMRSISSVKVAVTRNRLRWIRAIAGSVITFSAPHAALPSAFPRLHGDLTALCNGNIFVMHGS
jgi:hypothetical protein